MPGMDGTGRLFRPFTRFINDHGASDIEVQVVTYPEDKYLTYEQLADQVQGVLPESAPYVSHRGILLGSSSCSFGGKCCRKSSGRCLRIKFHRPSLWPHRHTGREVGANGSIPLPTACLGHPTLPGRFRRRSRDDRCTAGCHHPRISRDPCPTAPGCTARGFCTNAPRYYRPNRVPFAGVRPAARLQGTPRVLGRKA